MKNWISSIIAGIITNFGAIMLNISQPIALALATLIGAVIMVTITITDWSKKIEQKIKHIEHQLSTMDSISTPSYSLTVNNNSLKSGEDKINE